MAQVEVVELELEQVELELGLESVEVELVGLGQARGVKAEEGTEAHRSGHSLSLSQSP